MNLFVMTRYAVKRITDITSLMKTMVIGLNVLLAILNQIKENDQNNIDIITALYVFTLLLKILLLDLYYLKCHEFNFIIRIFRLHKGNIT